jgi:hypothetical protein
MSSPFLAPGAPSTFERTDQGVDFKTTPGGAIVAPYAGVVHLARPNPGGFGTHYPTITFTEGPWKGQTWYIGHTFALRTGLVRKGDPISRTGHGTESWVGNATGIPGHAEIGRLLAGGGYPSMSAGAAVKNLVLGGAGTSASGVETKGLASDILGAAPAAVAGAAGDTASGIVSSIFDALSTDGARILLYIALIVGGAVLAGLGTSRMFGLRASELPKAAAGKVAKTAAVA